MTFSQCCISPILRPRAPGRRRALSETSQAGRENSPTSHRRVILAATGVLEGWKSQGCINRWRLATWAQTESRASPMTPAPPFGVWPGRTPGSRSGVGWPVGILFGLASAFASSVGFLMRHRGASAAPDVEPRHPLRTAVALFRERWWALGYLVAFFAWALHVVSLKLSPLSLVQAAMASSFVFLGVAAERFFGLRVGRRQWWGMSLAAAGLALLGLTAGDARPNGAQSGYVLAGAVAVEAGLVAAGLSLILSPPARRAGEQRGVLLGAAAGLMFTVSHIGVKAL